jgi:hypothetical protein
MRLTGIFVNTVIGHLRTIKKIVGSRAIFCFISSRNRIAVNLSRAFLVLSIGWIAYTQTSHGQGTDLNIKKLKSELYVIEGTSNGSGDVGNVAVYVTSEGVILGANDRFVGY